MWRLGLQAAWLEEYDVEVPNRAGGVTVFDAVGNYNSGNPVARPLPEWRINGTLNWNYNNHRVFLIVKYVDSLDVGHSGRDEEASLLSVRGWQVTTTSRMSSRTIRRSRA